MNPFSNRQKKSIRRLQVVIIALKNLRFFKKLIRNNIHQLYEYGEIQSSPIESVDFKDICKLEKPVNLLNFEAREGNVSYYELLVIASLVRLCRPKNLVEIGTFDGNTTLQLALNSDEDAKIHTLDLGLKTHVNHNVLKEDEKYIFDQFKKSKKYAGTGYQAKIVEHIGDSRTYDFQSFCKRQKVDFAFIDAGHSYDCVKSDTEKMLNVVTESAWILWHDYSPNCSGVYRYLNELSRTYPLKRIEGTSLVFLKMKNDLEG